MRISGRIMRAMRVRVAYCVSAGLAAFILGVGPGAAEVVIEQATDYYDVTGSTAQEVRASLDRLGPTWELDGRHYDSAVNARYAWEFRFGPTARGCMMKAVTVKARIIITTPRLAVDASTPQLLQKAFAVYVAKLKDYDIQRLNMAIETGKRIDDGIMGLAPRPNCLELEPAANRLADNVQRDARRLYADYLRRTDAGRALGAVFPPAAGNASRAKAPAKGHASQPSAR